MGETCEQVEVETSWGKLGNKLKLKQVEENLGTSWSWNKSRQTWQAEVETS